jgi:hypothetical protein
MARRKPRVAVACVAALLALFSLDALLFRTNLYPSVVEPHSSAGVFELTLRRERRRQAGPGNLIVTLGDSRFAYLPRLANESTASTGYTFTSAGVAGSNPRMWYYMLRDLDPTARRYEAVVFGVDDFDDEDNYADYEDYLVDLHYLIQRLRLTDVFDFASSYRTFPHQWEAFRGSLFKGLTYQRDLHEFLLNPKKRIALVRFIHEGWQGWTYNFVEDDRSLKGLTVDWASRSITSSTELTPEQRQLIENVILRPVAPQTGRWARYRRKWLGRIIDRYRDSPTRIVFVRLARGPVPRPDNLVKKARGVIREFASSRPNVLLCDEHIFESLEHPELYKDALHLNREGSKRFSSMLAQEVRRVLGPPRSGKP